MAAPVPRNGVTDFQFIILFAYKSCHDYRGHKVLTLNEQRITIVLVMKVKVDARKCHAFFRRIWGPAEEQGRQN
jgi:hypothetical protein